MDAGASTLRAKHKQLTRTEIVRVAFELFGRHGIENVSVEMICEAAGISRATFFNYFKQKELILNEFAAARGEKLLRIVDDFRASRRKLTLKDVIELFADFSAENERLSAHSKALMLQIVFRQAAQGALIQTRNRVLDEVQAVIEPTLKKHKIRAVLETMFSVYVSATLEWLMQPQLPEGWLAATVRERMQIVLKGAE
ncbi:MAG TPA: TetR/AcrR family transcriptional regulator [Bryobacteraceae bacterium]|nr:TetR/AcrR family transcriptional regulator [Bryobacteraceae bacterium]